jgi:hypothetical protein
MVIYMTINLINGKRYIGADSKNNPNYIGSGVFLKKAIHKYGKSNFKKVILEECSNRVELREREIYWVKYYNAADNPEFYNMSAGGQGGVDGRPSWNNGVDIKHDYPDMYDKMFLNRKRANYDYVTDEWKNKHSKSILDSDTFQKNKNKKIESRRLNGKPWHSEETKKNIAQAAIGRVKTKEEIQKRIDTIRERGTLQGKNNPSSISVLVRDTTSGVVTMFDTKKSAMIEYGFTYYEISKRKSSDGKYEFEF